MKKHLWYASIPLGLFVVFYLFPKLIQFLFNSHSDVGIVLIVTVLCAIASFVGVMITKTYNYFEDGVENED